MRAYQKSQLLALKLEQRGLKATTDQAHILRRAELTLQRWGEAECGDSGPNGSWAIERDEKTGKPYRAIYPHTGQPRKYPIPDRERGALRRVAKVCEAIGAHFYHQTDPRGCALYVSDKPIEGNNYTNGVPCCD